MSAVRNLLATALLLIVLYPSLAFSQICGPQDYDAKVAPNFDCPSPEEEVLSPDDRPPPSSPVREGQVVEAPWDGALVHRDRLIQLGLRIKAIRRLRWVDRLHLAERYQLELEHLENVRRITQELLESQVASLRQRATAAEQRAERSGAWYRSIWMGLILGIVSSAVLVIGAAAVLTSI